MTRDEFIEKCDLLRSETKYSAKPWHVWLAEMDDHDAAQRQVIEQQATRIQELEEWQKIVTGTGTDQEAAVRMAATEYTKVAIQCWKEKCEQQAQQIATLKSELSQRTNLEGSAPCWNSAHMKQIATLREALDGMLFIFGHHEGYTQVQQAQQAIKEVKL